MKKKKLKIGLLIDNYNAPHWVYKMVDEINHSNHSNIVLIVKKENKATKKDSFLNSIWKNRKTFFFNLYIKFEHKLFRKNHNAFENKNLKDIIDCNEVIVRPVNTKEGDVLKANDIKKIISESIDVLIKIGFRTLQGDILSSSKYGVWSYYHGNYNITNFKLAGIWETLKKADNTKVSLNLINEGSKTKLYETAFNTDHLFITRNKNNIFWNSKSILPRVLNDLYNFGSEKFFQKYKSIDKQSINYNDEIVKTPKNFEILRHLANLYASAIKKVIYRKFFFDQWILLFKLEESKESRITFKDYSRLLPPKDRFWADPFIAQKDNKYYIFIEELIYIENKGKISVIEMDRAGNYSKPEVALETDYHLSYPFLIEDNDELYMIPETQQNNTIEIYKCSNFPCKWEFTKVLFNNIKAVDSTIFKYNNKYWLFTNIEEYQGISNMNELHLFYSDSILDENWISHPQNPITTDHSFSRSAGNIFIEDDKIFRPAQNCSKHYGYGIQLQEIIKMTETEYEEINAQSIHPDWDSDLLSTHTLSFNGDLTVIDAKISRRK